MNLIQKYKGKYDHLIKESDAMNNGTFIKTFSYKFHNLNLNLLKLRSLMEFREKLDQELLDQVEPTFFMTNFRFNSFELFFKIVKNVEICSGGARISTIQTILNEGDFEGFMKKYFFNMFICKYHSLEYYFYFNENVQIKDILDLEFSFDVYKVNDLIDQEIISYKIYQTQYYFDEVHNIHDKIRLNYHYPAEELIIIIKDLSEESLKNLFDSLKKIVLNIDGIDIDFKLSRNYKNIFVYNFVENLGDSINMSMTEYAYIRISCDKDVKLQTCLVNSNLIKFCGGMSGFSS